MKNFTDLYDLLIYSAFLLNIVKFINLWSQLYVQIEWIFKYVIYMYFTYWIFKQTPW